MSTVVGIFADSYTVTGPPWSPLDLTNLVGWWDASDAATFTFSSGVVVSAWADKSGNARHLAQGTVASQPSRNATLNGKSGVTFSSDDFVTFDAGAGIDNIDLSPWTCWAVIQLNTAIDASGRILTARQSSTATGDTSAPNCVPLFRSGSTNNVAGHSAGTASVVMTGGTTPMIVGSRMDGTNVYARVGASESAATSATAPGNMRFLRCGGAAASGASPPVGSASNFDGAIFELFICNANVTASNAVAYLQAKWAL